MDKLKLPINKVLNGNISGKEYEITNEKADGGNANGINNDNLKKIFAGTKEELLKLGEGTFEIKITAPANGATDVTLEIIDKSEFNGGKEYVMDTITFAKPAQKGNQTVEIAGITLELKELDTNTLPDGKSGGFEFTNSVSKEEGGIRLQVGANREQMIGLSVGNMRSRELGLGGIDVIGVGNAEEAIERIDEAKS